MKINNSSVAKQALIIFARKPELGKVKTRLAKTVGDEKALEIYKKLLSHTKSVISKIDCTKYVFLTKELNDDFWYGLNTELQQGESLGERMLYALELLFKKGHKNVLIIGTDCPSISEKIIYSGFTNLKNHDAVVGPAQDGGYYLLGMNQLHTSLFEGITWSSEVVLEQTVEKMNVENLSYFTLPTLNDVDEEKDVPADWL